MTPHEMDVWREPFEEAARKLGWTKKIAVVDHERDNYSWEETQWLSLNGSFLFSESDLSLGMLKEIMRVASLIP